MSDVETRVSSILEIMANATVSEMTKVIGGCGSTGPEDPSRATENTHGSPDQKVIQFSVFMTSQAEEAVEKICQLFHECSSLLQLEVTQGAAEIEDLRRRLEETELKLLLEGSRSQEEVEDLMEGGGGQMEGQRAEGETVRSCQRSGRKSRKAVASGGDTGVKRSPIIHLWKGRTYEPVIIKEEGPEGLADQASSDSGHYRNDPRQDDDDDPDYQVEPEDPDDGDPGYTTRSKRVVKPRSHRARAKESPSPKEQPLSCKHCRKTFSRLLQLKAHQAVHGAAAEKPFHCSQCGRGFSFQRSLNAHALLHTGERPHTCDVCGKGFTLKQLLRNHQRLHADVRPFRCEQCGKSFYRAHGLKMHQMVHTGERAYNCQYCNKSFTIQGPPADTHRGASLQLRHLRKVLHPEERLEDAPEDVSRGRQVAGVRGVRRRRGLRGLAAQTPADARGGHPLHLRALRPAAQLHHRPALAPAASHRGQASQLRPLREEFQVVQLPEDSLEDAQRGEALLLRHLRSHVYAAQQPEIASGGPHGRKTVQLRHVREMF
ncbi:zinc finger and SCAN domain-containing protein 22-like isoform X2 [Brachyistius frenatus]|uniref:zinc finger and SCAN domain-containing protein 22-like isoform X2 n=1 Tax=Brachyistius frenatus TaxID=100188 RepID=UPI0037E92F15